MSLRAKLLALFLIVAVIPLLALGGVEYTRSLQALERMIAAQNARVAERSAALIRNKAALIQSDLLLLSENVETQRWLQAHAAGAATAEPAREADRFFRDAWSRIAASYRGMWIVDSRGQVLYQLGDSTPDQVARNRNAGTALEASTQEVHDSQSGAPLGTVSLLPALPVVLPVEVLQSGFGETGFGMVVDRAAGRILYHPDRSAQGTTIASLIDAGAWQVSRASLDKPSGTFRYRTGDTLRVASFVSLTSPPWTVVVSGAVSEFAGPFTDVRRWTLLLFLAVAAGATLAFSHFLRRTTRSLEELTSATAVVGLGNLTPALPPAGRDEVGRLTTSFDTMVQKIREMVSQIESSRQMAVLGQFAAQLSHEIRNPLTSIKLNLQKLDRLRGEHRIPADADRPLAIALREVARLDGVVRGVLDLARARPRVTGVHSLHKVAQEALDVAAGQAEERQVAVERAFSAERDAVQVDHDQVKGALLNLVLNALEAMPDGGTLRLSTAVDDGYVRLTVADTGKGIPAEIRAEVFRPFFTTRQQGTGLGLPLAKRTIEDNGGTLTLSPENGHPGTEFVIRLPLSTTV